MFHVDNSTGVPVMPQPSPVTSETELFFTEGGNGVPPTYPGPDWFNVIQSELLNILKAAGIDPDKMDNTQILVALKKLFLSRSNPFGDIKADGAAAIAAALTNLGLADAIHGVSCDAAGFSGGDTAQPYFRHVDGSLVPLSTHSYTQTGLDGRQPKDATLTNLSGKDVAGLLQYLGLTKAVVVENQGSNANGKWRKYTDGTFEASGFISADPATGIAIVPLPVQFPAAPTTILVTQYIHDTSSRPGLTTVINSLSGATGFQTMSVDLTGAPYALGFAWRATYAPF